MSSDLEWYLDVGGKQSGPHPAKEIVEMVRAGKIPSSAHVTAARMGGDWVTAQDLIDAYDELYAKKTPVSMPIEGAAPFMGSTSPLADFAAPPRPTEQLEKSKFITVNREELEKLPDPAEALFAAIQAAREKANQKINQASTAQLQSTQKDQWGQLVRPIQPGLHPRIKLLLALVIILGIGAYGYTLLFEEKDSGTPVATPQKRSSSPSSTGESSSAPPAPSAKLLDDQGSGPSAARTAPPVRGKPSFNSPKSREGRASGDLAAPPRPVEPNGGARYREDDENFEDPRDSVDEADVDPNRPPEGDPQPIDPSQIPLDRAVPNPSEFAPGRGGGPNEGDGA